mmetsp:Transcript_29160/g.68302  ORF Transcript_29160/g.68302 Transcript_29160/m.68302 type:complete len:163 (+) Transcript_29160:923-1411(+)
MSPSDARMIYSILEPIVPDCEPRNSAGHASWMVVKSLGHNTVLTLDGFYEHPIRYGDELTIAVGDEDSSVLSVHFPAHDIYVQVRAEISQYLAVASALTAPDKRMIIEKPSLPRLGQLPHLQLSALALNPPPQITRRGHLPRSTGRVARGAGATSEFHLRFI